MCSTVREVNNAVKSSKDALRVDVADQTNLIQTQIVSLQSLTHGRRKKETKKERQKEEEANRE